MSVWENDGNALQSDWFEARDHCAELADEEKQILKRLGVSWLVCRNVAGLASAGGHRPRDVRFAARAVAGGAGAIGFSRPRMRGATNAGGSVAWARRFGGGEYVNGAEALEETAERGREPSFAVIMNKFSAWPRPIRNGQIGREWAGANGLSG